MIDYQTEVVLSPGAEKPFTAILRADGHVLLSRPVDTREQGEAILKEVMRKLPEFEKK